MYRPGKARIIALASLAAVGPGAFWLFQRGSPSARSEAALARITPGQQDPEIAAWVERVRRQPGSPASWTGLGDAQMQRARETEDVAHYGRAEAAYRNALALEAGYAPALLGMAWVCGARHEFEQSVAWAGRALERDPKNPSVYGLLGDAAVEQGDYEKAHDHYQKMLDLRPDLASYSRGAQLLFLTGDLRKAIWLMGKAVAAGAPHAENTAWCRGQLARMLLAAGSPPAAEQVVRQAVKDAPDNPELLAVLGKVLVARGRRDEAVQVFRKSVARAPQHEALVALGDLLHQRGERDEAEKQFALLEAIHRLHRSRGVRGELQMALFYADHDRNLPEALRQAEAEYRARKNVYAADALAWCLYKNRRWVEARRLSREARRLGTPEALFHFHAGMIETELGDRGAAQRQLARALSLDPHFHPVHARTAAETLRRLGSSRRG